MHPILLLDNLHLHTAHNVDRRTVQMFIKAGTQRLKNLYLRVFKRCLQQNRIADDTHIGNYAAQLDTIGYAYCRCV